MAVTGSGKGIQIVVGTDYNDRDLKRAQRDLNRLSAQAKKTQGPFGQLGAGIRNQLTPNLLLAGAAAAAFAVKLGVDAVKAAAEEEQAIARLTTALDNAGQAMAIGPVEAFIDGLARASGTADDDLRPAMITLINATKDATKAQNLLSLALDISAGSGRDLGSVTTALAKAANGQVTSLRRLGVPLSDAAIKSKDLAAITAELQATFGGQAAAAADTFQGRIKRLNVAFGELQEALGTGVIEGLESSTASTETFADAIKNLEPVVGFLGYQVGSAASEVGELTSVVLVAADAVGILDQKSGAAADNGLLALNNKIMDIAKALNPIQPLLDFAFGIEIRPSVAQSHADYRDAVVRSADAARDAVTYVNDMGDSVTESGDAAEDAALKYDIFAAAIDKTQAVVAFKQAIDEVGKAFKKTNVPVNIFGEKGKENYDLLEGLVTQTASYSEGQTTLAGRVSAAAQGLTSLEGAFKNAKMDPATRALLLEPFQALIDDLAELGVDVSGLQTQIDRLKGKDITITTRYEFPDGRPPGGWPKEWYGAVGGQVPQFLSGGGRSRGMDSVPAMLAPGEFVIRRQAVRQFGTDLFSQLNRGINPLAGMTPTAGGRGGGVQVGTINVTSAAGERAETSLPRALRRMAFLAGMNG